MRHVRHLLELKAPDVHAVDPDDAVIAAVRLMADKGIGAVLVMREARLVGILSERDYARKIVLQGRSSASTPVRDIMTADVIAVTPADSVDFCMRLMTEKRIRHLPVTDDDGVVGVISIGDLVKAVIEDQQETLDQLQRYITS